MTKLFRFVPMLLSATLMVMGCRAVAVDSSGNRTEHGGNFVVDLNAPYSNDSGVPDSTRACAPSGSNTLTIDNQAAVDSAYIEALKHEFSQNFAKLSCYLNNTSTPARPNITVVLREFTGSEAGYSALTRGNQIDVNASYIRNVGLSDPGMLTHEFVHVLQAYTAPVPGWVTEGIADYLRYLYTPSNSSWRLPTQVASGDNYTVGYGVTAAFFLWIEKTRLPGFVKALNTAVASGKYTSSYFKTHLGKSVDQLWAEYKLKGGLVGPLRLPPLLPFPIDPMREPYISELGRNAFNLAIFVCKLVSTNNLEQIKGVLSGKLQNDFAEMYGFADNGDDDNYAWHANMSMASIKYNAFFSNGGKKGIDAYYIDLPMLRSGTTTFISSLQQQRTYALAFGRYREMTLSTRQFLERSCGTPSTGRSSRRGVLTLG
jgi:hypothetical protein